MFLKRLEVQGFKSFADYAELYFGPGITAVVGPNGCGKSNIYDAINWVLGEQRARALRGTRMEDLIFSGSARQKPMGLAEVSLTFGNAERLNLQHSEITVTRRLYRSGESEYLINKKPCRLKDIQDIFADTGIGLNSYSMMEQGNVAMIIDAKPAERRTIFEEAAGISKFRQQKEEALRKLDYTRANLTRLADVIEEITRQMNSVNRHAAKARRYQKLYDQLKVLDITAARRRLDAFAAGMQAGADQGEGLQREQARAREAVQALTQELSARRQEASQEEKRRLELQAALHAEVEKISDAENRIRYNQQREADLRRRQEFLSADLERIDRELEGQKARLEALRGEDAELQKSLEAEKLRLQEATGQLQQADAGIREAREALQKAAAAAVDARRRLAEKNNRALSAQAHVQVLQVRAEKLRTGQHTMAVSFEEDEKTLSALRERTGQLQASVEAGRARAAGLEGSRRDLAGRLQEAERQLMETAKLIAEEDSKHQFLSGLKENYEGYQAAVKTLMTRVRTGELVLGGPCQTVADLLRIPEEDLAAAEALLGGRIQDVVVATVDDAVRCMDFLKAHDLGRVRLVVAELFRDFKAPDSGAEGARLLDRIECAPEMRGVAEYLVGDARVVDDVKPLVSRDGRPACVSAGGDVTPVRGVWAGGSARKHVPGILVRDRQIRQVEEQRARLASRRAEAQDRFQALKGEESALTEALSREREQIAGLERDLAVAQGQFQALDFKRGSSQRAYQANDQEIAELGVEIDRLRGEDQAVQAEAAGIAREEAEGQRRMTEFEQALAGLETARRDLAERGVECRIRHNALAEKHAGLASQVSELGRGAQRLADERQARVREQGDIGGLFGQIQEESAQKAAGLEGWRAERTKIEETIARAADGMRELQQRVERLSAELEAGHRELERLAGESTRREVEMTELRMNRENLVRRIREEYGFDLEGGVLEPGEVEVPAQGLDEEVARLREKIKDLGPVNLVAIEEYRELEERFNFLNGQREDLTASEQELRTAIDEINQTSTEMFSKSFEEIRTNFRKTFSMLFPGGEADLLLTDAQNILESGIDIEARPAGKKKQNLSLFSGGEKAMTSIALLFALFLSKPSPFCIMDEVDAPLDDSNISRFVDMVKDFASSTQFIIITHNKKTMAASREIYGVSMDPSGSSKLIALQFSNRGDGQLAPASS